MNALLDGTADDVARRHGIEPLRDLDRLFTISRASLIAHLQAMPERALEYLKSQMASTTTHDIDKMWKRGSKYFTAWMDHGRPTSVRRFKTLPEALAHHLLKLHGLYPD